MVYLRLHRHRSKIVVGCAVATLAGLVVLTNRPSFALPQLLHQTSDALERFVGRSPGERRDADIVKGKVKGAKRSRALGRVVTLVDEPEQRALGKVFDTPPEEALAQLLPTTEGPLVLPDFTAAGLGPLGVLPVTPGTALPGAGRQGGGGGGGGGAIGGGPGGTGSTGGSGGGNGGGAGGGGVASPPVVGAVPEPSTWALLLLGFFMTGGAMRKRRLEISRGVQESCAAS